MSTMKSISNCIDRVGRIELGQWIWGSYGATVSSIAAFAVGASRPTMYLAGTAGFLGCLLGSIGVSALKSRRERRTVENRDIDSPSEIPPVERPSEKPGEDDPPASPQ